MILDKTNAKQCLKYMSDNNIFKDSRLSTTITMSRLNTNIFTVTTSIHLILNRHKSLYTILYTPYPL